jgi:murein L,D-transpeptidase YafK
VPPKVDVCEKRYVFNVTTADGSKLSPTGACPTVSEPGSLGVAYQSYQKKYDAAFSAAVGKGEAPKPSIQGIQEANLVKDWTKRRARGERISMDPPSMQPDGTVVVTSQMGRANNEAGRKMAAQEAAEAAKQREAEEKAAAAKRAEEAKIAAAEEAKRQKELAELEKAQAAQQPAASAEAAAPAEAAPAEAAPAEAVATAPAETDTGVVGSVRKRLGKLFGG